jgi:hypothetical protein
VKIGGASIGERPLLFLGVLLIVVGVQIASLGLLGQMIAATRRDVGADRERASIVAATIGFDEG